EAAVGARFLARISAFAPLVRRPTENDGRVMEPETQLFLAMVAAARRPPIHSEPPAAARAQYADFLRMSAGAAPAMVRRLDLKIEAADRLLPLRVLYPVDAHEPLPVILYFHGGGYVIGSVDTDDAFCRRLAQATG